MIRPMLRNDFPMLARLHGGNHPNSLCQIELGTAVYSQLLAHLFFDHPGADARYTSLVSEDRSGNLNGMLAVMNRPYCLGGRPITAAVSAELFVAPNARSGLCGVQLLKRFLDGPQELSIADVANDTTRRLWTGLGGQLLALESMTWMALFDPCRFALSAVWPDRVWGLLAAPLARLADSIARGFRHVDIQEHARGLTGESLTSDQFADLAPQFLGHHELRPIYSRELAQWLWGRLNCITRNAGPSRQTLVLDSNGVAIGWHIAQWRPGGVVRVSQLAARPGEELRVLAHLLVTAARAGAPGVMGRIQPGFLNAYREYHCLLARRPRHVLIHSRDASIRQAFERGQAFLSLLDGEGAVQLWNNPEIALHRCLQNRPENRQPSNACPDFSDTDLRDARLQANQTLAEVATERPD